ncbi:DNA repair protein RecN (Recombination protein N) [Georgenia soli]|uniref:DNA repair protein RecN n=1 Tax=Georgenia soli TaxID=638953 RepID=A0A2A9EJB2_9MICO|nr:DNA repair protein RecN [Georgenia soli]PFG38342.1 DNA repair protein RecN (Recombination protein N) [Georgenia soli]
MIEQVRIENLGVIAAAELDLAPTFTVITGETGAGKTMVLTSLALLLGGKADPALVRRGAERAVVEGTFAVAPAGPAATRAEEAGAAVEDGELIVARTVPAAGRSRAHLGGRTVPHAVLGEIGEQLVTVHGQSEQLRLRAPAQQRAALDAFGGEDHAALLAAYRTAWATAVAAREELAAWEEAAGVREQEIAQLRAGLARIEELDPQPGEDHALREEAGRLGNVEELREAAGRAYQGLTGGDDVTGPGAVDATTLIEDARRSLEQGADDDAALGGWAERLAEASYLVSDVATEIASYLSGLDADPQRLAWVNERRAVLAELTRVHGPDVDGALAWAERARERLAYLDGPEDTAEKLRSRVADAEEGLARAAAALTDSRRAVGERLATAVDEELAGLAMAGAHLSARLTPLEEPGPSGAEAVELLLAAHPGAPARPLGQGASGGELSRVMLAIEVALAAVPGGEPESRTFVFDEVDAGVGGKAAVEVGRRLARLAQGAQVVVVTHLAQVAAFADRHLVVSKHTPGSGDAITATDVTSVDGEDRLRELARMLSGQEESETALRHAAELLERATVQR